MTVAALGEGSLRRRLLACLVDDAAAGRPGLCGLALWRSLQATGAELVWRCRQDVKLPVLEVFADGFLTAR